MKRIMALLLTLVLSLSMVACGSDDTQTGGEAETDTPKVEDPGEASSGEEMGKYEGETLVIWSFTDELKPAIEYFEEKFGVTVELTIMPHEDYTQAIKPVLQSGVGAPDVYTAEAAFVEEFVNNGFYANLSQDFGVDAWASGIYGLCFCNRFRL